jgi:hypothetical protein
MVKGGKTVLSNFSRTTPIMCFGPKTSPRKFVPDIQMVDWLNAPNVTLNLLQPHVDGSVPIETLMLKSIFKLGLCVHRE